MTVSGGDRVVRFATARVCFLTGKRRGTRYRHAIDCLYSEGDTPMNARNVCAKWLGDEKPSAIDTAVAD